MHIKVLGTGCSKCNTLEKKIREIVTNNNIDAIVTKVSEMNEISQYGIVMTPGIVIDEKLISVGSVPSEKQILNWLMEAKK